MADNRNLHVTLQVDANTKKAQEDFKQLQNTLQKLSYNAITIDTEGIQKAGQAAQELSNHLTKAFNINTGQLDLNKFSASLKASGNDLASYRQKLEAIGPEGQKAFMQVANSIASADAPLIKTNTRLTEFLGTLKNTARWQISSSILHGFMGSLQQAMGYAKNLNENLTNIQIVTNASNEAMAKFANTANKAAKELSTTTNKYAEASLIYFQQGLNAAEVEKRAAATIKLAQVSGESAEEASSQMTAIWNNFYDGSKSLEYYADVLTALGAATASSTEEISTGLQKFASIGETVGLSYEYAASALATITATSRESADTVGNALKTLFSRIEGLKLGNTLEDGTDLNKYSAALAKVGVNIKDTNGELRDMDNILDDLGERWTQLSRDQQVALAETVAGVRQYSHFMTLMNKWDFMEENLQIAYGSEGTLTQQAEIYANSWEASSARVQAALETIYNSLIDDKFFINLNDLIAKVLDGVNGLINGLGGLPGILAIAGSFITNELANAAPNALNQIKEDILILTNQSEKLANQTRFNMIEELRQDSKNSNSAEYQLQIEKLQTISELKSDLKSKSNQLTDAQKQEYEVLIQMVEAEFKRQEALAKTVDDQRDLVENAQEQISKELVNKLDTDSTQFYYAVNVADYLGQYSAEIGKINAIQEQANNLLNSFGQSGQENFINLRNKTVAWLDELRKSGQIDLQNPSMSNMYRDIKYNVTSIEELKDKIKTIASDKSFDGLAQDIYDSAISLGELEKQTDIFKKYLQGLGVSETAIETLVGTEQELGLTEAQLKALEEVLEKMRQKAPQVQGSFTKAFGKGTSLIMNFSSLLSGLTNLFTTWGNKGASASQKITSSIGAAMTATMLLRQAFDFSQEIAALSNMTGSFANLGAAIAPIAPAIVPITIAIGALTAAFAAGEAEAKLEQERLEKVAETAKKAAEESQARYDEFIEEKENNDELIESYESALEAYKATGEGKQALAEAAIAVAEAFNIENGAIDVALGRYDLLITKAKQVQSAQLETWRTQAQINVTAQGDALSTTYQSLNEKSGYQHINGKRYKENIDQIFADRNWAVTFDGYSADSILNFVEGEIGEQASELKDIIFKVIKNNSEQSGYNIGLAIEEALSEVGSQLIISDGADNQWDNNKFIEQAFKKLNFTNYFTSGNGEKGGLGLSFDTDNAEAAYEAYKELSEVINYLYNGNSTEDERKSTLFQNMLHTQEALKEQAESYENSISEATIAEFEYQASLVDEISTTEDLLEVEQKTSEALEKKGYNLDLVKEKLKGYISTNEDYKNLQSGRDRINVAGSNTGILKNDDVITSEELDNFWEKHVSEKARSFLEGKELTLPISTIVKLQTDPEEVGEQVSEEIELYQKQLDNEEKTLILRNQRDAFLNNNFKSNMTDKQYEKFKTESNIDWGNEELNIISYEDFLNRTVEDQAAYLSSTGERLSNSYNKQIKTNEETLIESLDNAKKKVNETATYAENAKKQFDNAVKNWQSYDGQNLIQLGAIATQAESDVKDAISEQSELEDKLKNNTNEAALNSQLAITSLQTAINSLSELKNNDILSEKQITGLQLIGLDEDWINSVSIDIGNGQRQILTDIDIMQKEIQDHLTDKQVEIAQQNFTAINGQISSSNFSAFEEQIAEMQKVGIEIDKSIINGMINERDEIDTTTEAYKTYLAALQAYNETIFGNIKNNIKSFDDAKKAFEARKINLEAFKIYQQFFENAGTWTSEVKTLEDFMEKITPDENEVVEIENVYEAYKKIQNVVSELSAKDFLGVYNKIDIKDQANFIKENIGKLKITLEDLNNVKLQEALGKENWEKVAGNIDITDISIKELEEHINDSGMTAEIYSKLLESILKQNDTETIETINALNKALKEGKYSSEEYLKSVNNLLTGDEKLKEINSKKKNIYTDVDENGQKIKIEGEGEEYALSAEDRFSANLEVLKDNTLSATGQLEALQKAHEALLETGKATNMQWIELGRSVTEVYKDLGKTGEETFPEILKGFGSDENGKIFIPRDRYEAVKDAIISVFGDLKGSAEDNLNALNNILAQHGLSLKKLGLDAEELYDSLSKWNADDLWDFQKIDAYRDHFRDLVKEFDEGSDEVKQFADQWIEFITSSQDMSTQEKLNDLSEAFNKGGISAQEYVTAVQEVIKASNDLGLTSDQAKNMALDMVIELYESAGLLDEMASSLGRNVKSMQDLQQVKETLAEHGVDIYEAEKEGLIALGVQYDELTEKVEAYRHALSLNNEEIEKSAEDNLALGIQCKELSEAYDVEYDLIYQLAQQYRDLGDSGDEFYKACADNTEIAADMAARYIRVNDGIKDLEENWEEYEGVITRMSNVYKNSGKSVESLNSFLYDNYEAVDKIREAVAKTLAVKNKDIITNEMLAEHADLVTQACYGNIDAILELQKVMAKNLSAKLGIDDTDFWSTLDGTRQTFLDWIENLPEGKLSIDNTLALQKLSDMMYEAGMTADQIEDYFRGMGIEVDFADDFITQADQVKETVADAIAAIQEQGYALNEITAEQVQTYLEQRGIAEEADLEMINQSLQNAADGANEKLTIKQDAAIQEQDIAQTEADNEVIIEENKNNQVLTSSANGNNKYLDQVAQTAQQKLDILNQRLQKTDEITKTEADVEAENASQVEPQQYEDTTTSTGEYQFVNAKTVPQEFSVTVPTFEASLGKLGFPTFKAGSETIKGLSYTSIVGEPSNPVQTQDKKETKFTHPKIIGATKVGGGIGQPSRIVSPQNSSGANRATPQKTSSSSNGGSAPSAASISKPTFKTIDSNNQAVDEYADYHKRDRPDEKWHDETYTKKENYKDEIKAEVKDFFEYDATDYVKVDEEIDRYHDINQELEKIQTNLDEISERKGRAFGQRHLDAINDEKNALKEQIQASEELMAQYKQEAGEIGQELRQDGFELSADGTITNYENGITQAINASNNERRAILAARNQSVAQANKELEELAREQTRRNNKLTDEDYQRRLKIDQEYDKQVKANDEKWNSTVISAADRRWQEQNSIEQRRAAALNELTAEMNRRNEEINAAENAQKSAIYSQYSGAISGHNASIQAQWAESKNIADDESRKAVQEGIKELNNAGKELSQEYQERIKAIEQDFNATRSRLKIEEKERESAIKAAYDLEDELSQERYDEIERVENQRYERQGDILDRMHEQRLNENDIRTENMEREIERWAEEEKDRINKEYEGTQNILDMQDEAAQNRLERTLSNVEKIDDLTSNMRDLTNEIQKMKNQYYDTILEGIQYSVDLKIRVNDEALKAIEVLIDNVGDSLDKVTDKMALLTRQMNQLGISANTSFDGIKALIEFRDQETGLVLTDIDSNGIWKKFLNGGLTDSDFKQIKDSNEYTEEQIAALESYRDKLIETLSSIKELRENQYEAVADAFNKMMSKLDEESDKLDYLAKKANHYKDVIGILGRKVLDSTGILTKNLDQSVFNVAQNTTKSYKQMLDTVDSDIANLEYQKNRLTDPEEIERFNELIDDAQKKRQETYQNWLDAWKSELEAATTYFKDSIEIIADIFDKKLSGSIGSLSMLSSNFDRERERQEMYVEDYEKIYQLSKLSRDVQNSIDDTEHIKNKAQLKKLMAEINQASEEESKMSQYDLDVLQKKYELEVARLEMEEARNVKSRVRMSRDANGNYGYIYTADENDVAEAEQNYEDKLHELQVLNTDYIKSLEEQIIQTDQDCRDAIASLSMSDFASYQEYEAEVNRIREHYSKLRDQQLQQMTNATRNNRTLYEEDWTEYSKHTGYKISADENYLDKFNETTYSVLTGFADMTTARDTFQTGLNEMIASALGTYITTSDMYQQALADGDTSVSQFGDTVIDTTEDIGASAEKITSDIKTMAETFQDSFRDMTKELKTFIDEYVKNYKPVIEDMTHLVEGLAGLINYQAYGEASGEGAVISGVGKSDTDYSLDYNERQTYTSNTKLAPYFQDIAALLSADYEGHTKGWGQAGSATAKARIDEVFGNGAYEDLQRYMNKNSQKVQDLWASRWGTNGSYFDYASYEALRKKIKGYDTGGYTGDWNSNSGKLALLHEKELVLNKEDTQNILNSVEAIRDIARIIDLNALSASQFMGSLYTSATVSDKEQIIEQEVHITAEFPNASDKNEIIDAFDELINVASQYVNRK